MYTDFFGLRDRPFDLTPSPRFLVATESHREALRNLEYGIASRKGITLLVGEAGSGKTTVIRAAIGRLPMRVHCVHINNPTLSRAEFVETLAAKFGLSEKAQVSKALMLAELEALLIARYHAGETTVLIVDEAQSLPLALIEEIRLLANIETDQEKLLSVIIAGQPELAERLNTQELRQLKQRVALRCELRPLTRPEVEMYVSGRIRAAGGVGSQVFTREAVWSLADAAKGLPRTINVIADNALLGGFAAGVRPVGRDIVLDVCRDFDLSPAGESVAEGKLSQVGAGAGDSSARDSHARQAGEAPDASELFGAFARRRKRFSFFWN
jgi:general secretion pathway protein A